MLSYKVPLRLFGCLSVWWGRSGVKRNSCNSYILPRYFGMIQSGPIRRDEDEWKREIFVSYWKPCDEVRIGLRKAADNAIKEKQKMS